MGRWLSKIQKRVAAIPAKPTKLGFGGFVGIYSSHLQNKKLLVPEQKTTCDNQIDSHAKEGFVGFVGIVPSAFPPGKGKPDLNKGRLEVLRILIWRFLRDEKCRCMVAYQDKLPITNKAVERYLNSELVNFGFDLETMIDMYRIYAPKPKITLAQCVKCGYRPLFCSCKDV